MPVEQSSNLLYDFSFLTQTTTDRMDNLIKIVRTEMMDWEKEVKHANRNSVFSEHILLANKIRQHQHLAADSLPIDEEDAVLDPTLPRLRPESTMPTENATVGHAERELAASSRDETATVAVQADPRPNHSTKSSSSSWTWKPAVPQRISSMRARRTRSSTATPDLVGFHRRSCQLFSSLDSTLASAVSSSKPAPSSPCSSSHSRTSTSPSSNISVSTQATSLLDDDLIDRAYHFMDLDFSGPQSSTQNTARPAPDFGDLFSASDHVSTVSTRRSSSRLSPRITSTNQVFWTSPATRSAEYTKIDAAHSGFRGFVKRLLPRRWIYNKRRDFCVPPTAIRVAKDTTNDCESVHRYRLSIASATQEAIHAAETHGVGSNNVNDLDATGAASISALPRIPFAYHNAGTRQRTPGRKLKKARSTNALAKLFGSTSVRAADKRLSKHSSY